MRMLIFYKDVYLKLVMYEYRQLMYAYRDFLYFSHFQEENNGKK